MSYKDSFVDEYPYLVYSDDPEAVGGAGGDIGFTQDDTAPSLTNHSGTNIDTIPILADAEGKKTVAVVSTADEASILIAPNAYIGLVANSYYIYAGDIDAGERITPAGSFTMGEVNFNTYQITDPDETYSIYAL